MESINHISHRTVFRILLTVTAYIILLMVSFAIRRELIWLAAALFLAFALNPPVAFISRWMPGRNRGLAIAVVFGAIISLFLLLFLTFLPPLTSQSRSLARTLPDYVARVQNGDNWVGRDIRKYGLVQKLKDEQNQILHDLTSQSGSIFGVFGRILSSLTAFLTIVAATFFMLLEGPVWLDRMWELMPRKNRRHYKELANKMYQAVTSYVIGTFIACLIGGAATSVMLYILKVPFAIPLGILVALLELIPLIGGFLAGLMVFIICLFSSISTAVVMVIFFGIFLIIDNHVVRPIVYGKAVGVSPLLVLIAIIIGTASTGFVGALVAIPLAASLQILAIDYFSQRDKQSTSVQGRTS